MAFIPASDVIEAELRFLAHGNVMENTLYFLASTTFSTADMNALAEDLNSWWVTNMKPLTGSYVQFLGTKVTDLTSIAAPAFEVPVSGTVVGDDTGDPIAQQVALCLSLLTDARGRSYRGRNYVGGFTESAMTGGMWGGTHATNVRGAYELITVVADTNDMVWSVLSRYHLGVPRSAGVATPITNIRANLIPAIQRKRRIGSGS